MAIQQFDDTFTRANTSVGSGADSTTGVGNGWIDHIGTRFSITSNRVVTSGGGSYLTGWLWRPASEDKLYAKIVVKALNNGSGSGSPMALLRINRSTVSCYAVYMANATTLTFLYLNGGGQTVLGGSMTGVTTGITTGDIILTFTATPNGTGGTNLVATVANATAPATVIQTLTLNNRTDANVQAAGGFGIANIANFSTFGEVTTYDNAPGSFVAWPTGLKVNATGKTVTLTGTATAWLTTTPTVTISGPGGAGTPASITAQSIISDTQIQLTVSAGNGTGAVTLTDPSTGATATLVIVSATVDDAAWWHADAWYVDADKAALSGNMGAVSKFAVTNTTTLKLVVDQVMLGALVTPTLKWRIGDGAWQSSTATSATASQIDLSPGTPLLVGTTYQVVYYLASVNTALNRWLDPAANSFEGLRVTGLILDAGGSMVSPTLETGRMLIKGNSISEGYSNGATQDGLLTWGMALGAAFGCEVSQVGWSGASLTVSGGTGSVPALYTVSNDAASSWNKWYAGKSRLSGGLYPHAYDWLLTMQGRNDIAAGTAAATVSAALAAYLTAERAALGATTQIVFILDAAVPISSTYRAALIAGFTTYQGSVSSVACPVGATLYKGPADSATYLLDLGTDVLGGLVSGLPSQVAFGTASYRSLDGAHPTVAMQGELGARVAAALRFGLAPSGTSVPAGLHRPGHRR